MATTYKMIPMGQVLDTFAKMPDGEAQLEKAYPGITNPMGYLAHVKVDSTTGAWMLKVPQHVEDEIAQHKIIQNSKIQNQMNQGRNPTTLAGGHQAAPAMAAQQKMSKQAMQASLKKPMATPTPEPDNGEVGTGTPSGSQPGPEIQTTKGQPDVSMGAAPITPFLASVVPSKGVK